MADNLLEFQSEQERHEFRVDVFEDKLRQWVIDHGVHTPCTREEAKYGCLMCQELYKIIDELFKKD